MSKAKPEAVIGRTIGTLVPLLLQFWAAIGTAGALHWCLIGWLSFSAVVFIAFTAVKVEAAR
jgi:hypothetical protein